LPGLLLCGMCACGGHSGGAASVLNGQPANSSAAPSDLPGGSPAERSAAWEKLANNPGVAGKDYDPQRITVTYLPAAAAPAGWGAGQPPAGASAASQPNPQLRQNTRFEPLTDAIAARYGLTIAQQVYLKNINFASFTLPAAVSGATLLPRLRSELAGQIEAAVFTPLQHLQYSPNDPDYAAGPLGPEWGHWQINCAGAWDKTKGSASVMIAVVDTGVRLTHQELSAQVINPQTAFPGATCDLANNDKSIEDTQGHGTFIAGIVCAQMDNNRTLVGVAPQCKVLPIKISNNGTAPSDVLTAGSLLAGQLGAKVVNFSWGGYDDDPNEHAMVDSLTADGVLFVCAAGNDALETDDYPTAYANALSVGATDETDTCTDFSNWGFGVDVAAPGIHLKSCGCQSDSDYGLDEAGTSFAAPMVAAVGGLLWSYKPTLTEAQVRSALVNTGPLAWDFALPILRLDAGAALNSVVTPVTPSVAALKPAAQTTAGAVAGQTKLTASLVGAVNVAHVTYTLDLAPVGTAGPEDISLESTGGGQFAVQFDLAGLKNQTAALSAKYYSATGNNATLSLQPLWIFNQRGDIDGDGVVGSADLVALQGLLGKTPGDPQYVSYADSDQDGKITEADAAAVGYNFGFGAVKPEVSGVTPTTGQSGSQVSISATVTGSGQLNYNWDFGGGAAPNTSTAPSPTVTYGAAGSYSATLSVSSEFGSAQFPFTLTVTPRPGPTAALVPTPAAGVAPLTVNFDASGSTSPGGSIVKYEWSWDGDETWEDTTTAPSDSHVFTNIGTYTVRLRVTDDAAKTAETTVDIDAQARPGPSASFIPSPSTGSFPLNVNFDASASNSPGGNIVKYEWSWDGDETWEDTTISPLDSHEFDTKGSYNVRLRVTDDQNLTAETTTPVQVLDPSDPTAYILTDVTDGVVPLTVSFDAEYSTSLNGPIIQYDWSWDGDETWEDSSTLPQTSHTFASAGPATVRLRVTDSTSRTGETTIDIGVRPGIAYSSWGETTLGQFGYDDLRAGLRIAAANVGGKPAVAWLYYVGGHPSSLSIARAKVASPQNVSDWKVDQVASATLSNSLGISDIEGEVGFVYGTSTSLIYGRYSGDTFTSHQIVTSPSSIDYGSLSTIGGKPAVIYNDSQFNPRLMYGYAATSQPHSPSDWTLVNLSGITPPMIPYYYGYHLADVSGRPMCAFESQNAGQMNCYYAASGTPTGSDWSNCTFSGHSPGFSEFGYLFSDGNLPAVLYFSATSNQDFFVNYSRASNLQPQSTDWTSYQPTDDGLDIDMATDLDGSPAFGWSNTDLGIPRVFIAGNNSPQNSNDWTEVKIPSQFTLTIKLANHNHLPAMLALKGSASPYDLVYRYPIP
jgi:PKD repeat protein